jgi:hypothetical protein
MLAAMLLSQGVNIIGSLNSAKQAKLEGGVQKKAAELNAETQRTAVMEQYTDIFSKQTSELASQSAIFANAGIDKAGSLFRQGMRVHERNFLDSKADMESDMRNIDLNLKSQKYNIDSQVGSKKNEAYSNVVSGLFDMATTYFKYNVSKGTDVDSISGGRKVAPTKNSQSVFREIARSNWLG